MRLLKALGASAILAAGLGLAGAASAAPGLGTAPLLADSAVTQALGGCGPGFAPGRFGGCRPFGGPRFGGGPRYGYGGPGYGRGPRFDRGPRGGYGRSRPDYRY